MNPTVVSKLISFTQHYIRKEFSSEDSARWLKSTERNGRRILMDLEKEGIIEQCGEVHQAAGAGLENYFTLSI